MCGVYSRINAMSLSEIGANRPQSSGRGCLNNKHDDDDVDDDSSFNVDFDDEFNDGLACLHWLCRMELQALAQRRLLPQGSCAEGRVAHYAATFPAVEINSSYHALPKWATYESWREREAALKIPGGHFQHALKVWLHPSRSRVHMH